MKQLPNGWRRVELGELGERYLSGGTPATGNTALWDGEVAWTTSAPIGASDVRLDKAQRFISSVAVSQSSTNLVPKGNLLVGTRVGVGKAVVNEIDIAISQDLTGLILDKAIEPSFAAFAFKLNEIQNFLDGRKRGTTIKGISRLDLASVPLNLPPLPQQRAIVSTLSAIQSARDARIAETKLEREHKAALTARLFVHGTRGVAAVETPLGKLPNNWEATTLGKISKIERGKFSHRPRNDPAFYGGNIPFIQTGDVTNSSGFIEGFSQTLNEKGLSVSRIFPKGTIVITIAANIGYAGILTFDCAFPDSLIGITCSDRIENNFLNYYLATQQKIMDEKAPQGTQKNINIEFLAPWPVICPPLEEQREIAAILRACDDKIAALEDEATRLEELFRAMLEELMSGRICVAALTDSQLTP